MDSGNDTIEKLASSDPEVLREGLIEIVKANQFDGMAPLPGELKAAIGKAKKLPKIVEY